MRKLRQLFLRGLFALIPIVATIYLVNYLFFFFDNFLGSYIEKFLGRQLPGVGIIATLHLVFLFGFLVSNVFGEKLLKLAERTLQNIPILPKVYFGIKQIVDAFSLQGKQVFNKVVLVEYPRQGVYVLGFVTGECKGEVQERTSARLINVFIPTTPNPTSGMLVLIPDNEIIYLNMSVEEGLKLIVSAGVFVPDYPAGSISANTELGEVN